MISFEYRITRRNKKIYVITATLCLGKSDGKNNVFLENEGRTIG